MTRCILCDTSEVRPIYRDERVEIVQCIRCGLVRQANYAEALAKLNQAFESAANYYETRGVVTNPVVTFDPKRLIRTADIQQELVARLSPGSKIVDIGCGSGEFAFALSESGFDVVGVEPNPMQANYVEGRLGVHAIASLYRAGLFAPSTFNGITLIQVLEHLENPLELLAVAYEHLKPRGVLVIDVPSFNNPRILMYRLLRWKRLVHKDFVPVHNYYYTAATLSRIVEKAGFRPIKVQTGRYATKFGYRVNPVVSGALGLLDQVANYFRIGGITLYALKP